MWTSSMNQKIEISVFSLSAFIFVGGLAELFQFSQIEKFHWILPPIYPLP